MKYLILLLFLISCDSEVTIGDKKFISNQCYLDDNNINYVNAAGYWVQENCSNQKCKCEQL